MATDSSAAGFLAPIAQVPYDQALEDILHDIVQGMTALPGEMVRPRWQPEPATRPDFTVDWVAFGVVRTNTDVFAHHHQRTNEEQDVSRDELLYVLHSFYGPSCTQYAERFRDGFEIGQNRDEMKTHRLELVEVQDATHLPALLKEKWVQRVDVTVIYRRRTVRTYPVLTIQSAQATLDTDSNTTSITVNP